MTWLCRVLLETVGIVLAQHGAFFRALPSLMNSQKKKNKSSIDHQESTVLYSPNNTSEHLLWVNTVLVSGDIVVSWVLMSLIWERQPFTQHTVVLEHLPCAKNNAG